MIEPPSGQLALWNPDRFKQLPSGRLDLPEAEAYLYPCFFSCEESDALFAELRAAIPWRSYRRVMYDRELDVPRVSTWYGPDRQQERPEVLHRIQARIQTIVDAPFNTVLCHLYRDERDSVAWHADKEAQDPPYSTIASISFGATRRFLIKHQRRRDLPTTALELVSGSVLVMAGDFQKHWLHCVPKSARKLGERINLTYRIASAIR